MVVPFDVTFAPTEINQELRCDNVPCAIEGGKPIRLTLSGSCIAPPVVKEVGSTPPPTASPLSSILKCVFYKQPVCSECEWNVLMRFLLW